MAESDRDKSMRVVGQLQAAVQMLEMINVPHRDKRTAELKNAAQSLLNKAMLAAWERADEVDDGRP